MSPCIFTKLRETFPAQSRKPSQGGSLRAYSAKQRCFRDFINFSAVPEWVKITSANHSCFRFIQRYPSLDQICLELNFSALINLKNAVSKRIRAVFCCSENRFFRVDSPLDLSEIILILYILNQIIKM